MDKKFSTKKQNMKYIIRYYTLQKHGTFKHSPSKLSCEISQKNTVSVKQWEKLLLLSALLNKDMIKSAGLQRKCLRLLRESNSNLSQNLQK